MKLFQFKIEAENQNAIGGVSPKPPTGEVVTSPNPCRKGENFNYIKANMQKKNDYFLNHLTRFLKSYAKKV